MVPDSWAKCQMMGEGNFLLNTPFFITGGTGNPIFGNSSRGGGCVVLYYTNLYDAAGVSRNGNFGDKYRFMVVETPGITALVVAYLLLHVTSIWVIMGALNVMEGMERPAPTQE